VKASPEEISGGKSLNTKRLKTFQPRTARTITDEVKITDMPKEKEITHRKVR
jgi:hypothetical protein